MTYQLGPLTLVLSPEESVLIVPNEVSSAVQRTLERYGSKVSGGKKTAFYDAIFTHQDLLLIGEKMTSVNS